MERVPEIALEWHRAGRGAVLCTVVQTWGSAPRRVGAQLVVSGASEIEGSVSGGCVEGAVVAEALDALATGTQCIVEYGVSDGDAFAVGLACGGTIRILIEPVGAALPESVLSELVDARAAREAVAIEADLVQGDRKVIRQGYEDRFRLDRSGFADESERYFVTIHNPPLRLLIVGAVHIAQALAPMSRMVGFDPILIDPREAFGSSARFPGETVVNDWPDEGVRAFELDSRTAVVLLTHDPKLDDPALIEALRSDVFYIGALGSTLTQAKRRERMRDAGFSKADIARIHGPVGLDIGASNPSEIALSIMAEMTRVLRTGA